MGVKHDEIKGVQIRPMEVLQRHLSRRKNTDIREPRIRQELRKLIMIVSEIGIYDQGGLPRHDIAAVTRGNRRETVLQARRNGKGLASRLSGHLRISGQRAIIGPDAVPLHEGHRTVGKIDDMQDVLHLLYVVHDHGRVLSLLRSQGIHERHDRFPDCLGNGNGGLEFRLRLGEMRRRLLDDMHALADCASGNLHLGFPDFLGIVPGYGQHDLGFGKALGGHDADPIHGRIHLEVHGASDLQFQGCGLTVQFVLALVQGDGIPRGLDETDAR